MTSCLTPVLEDIFGVFLYEIGFPEERPLCLSFEHSYLSHVHRLDSRLFRRTFFFILVALVSILLGLYTGYGGRLFPLYLGQVQEEIHYIQFGKAI